MSDNTDPATAAAAQMVGRAETHQDALDMAQAMLEQARNLMSVLLAKGEALIPRELLGLTALECAGTHIRVQYDKGCDLVSMWTCQAGALAQLATAMQTDTDMASIEWDDRGRFAIDLPKGRKLGSSFVPADRCTASYSTPGGSHQCVLAAGHDGDHKDPEVDMWWGRRDGDDGGDGPDRDPSFCPSAHPVSSGAIWHCRRGVGHDGEHNDGLGYTWTDGGQE